MASTVSKVEPLQLDRDGLGEGPSKATVEDVERRIIGVASMVDDCQQPFREVAFELGKLLRIAADLADPSITGAETGIWQSPRVSSTVS